MNESFAIDSSECWSTTQAIVFEMAGSWHMVIFLLLWNWADKDCWAQQLHLQITVQLPQNWGSDIGVLDQACLVCIAQCPKAPGTGLCLAGEGCRARLPCGCGSRTGTGAHSDDAKQNVGKGKGASSFLDMSSAKPGLCLSSFGGIFEHDRHHRKGR